MTRLADIMAAAGQHYGVSRYELLGSSKGRQIVTCRFAVYHLGAKKLGYGVARIGALCDRDHTSVLHGIRKVAAMLERDPTRGATLETIWQAAVAIAEKREKQAKDGQTVVLGINPASDDKCPPAVKSEALAPIAKLAPPIVERPQDPAEGIGSLKWWAANDWRFKRHVLRVGGW